MQHGPFLVFFHSGCRLLVPTVLPQATAPIRATRSSEVAVAVRVLNRMLELGRPESVRIA